MTRAPYDPHRHADGVNRADRGLRRFAGPTVIGGATMCPTCHGGGYELERRWTKQTYDCMRYKQPEPRRCTTCNGEGLDPDVHGARR